MIIVKLAKVPSLNQFYSGMHWSKRDKITNLLKLDILSQLSNYPKVKYEKISVTLRCNYRYDIDNSIMAVKFALDVFRRWGGVKDDSPKYLEQVTLIVDKSLPRDTALVEIAEKK